MSDESLAPGSVQPLWATDTGTLPEEVRRVLVALLKGPYISRARQERLWTQLIASEEVIRSRLADFFAELVMDDDAELAFVRNAPFPDAPLVIRSQRLTFLQTALILELRRILLGADATDRALIDLDEAMDKLEVYRVRVGVDRAGFAKRVRTAWTKLHEYGVLSKTSTEDRAQISPILRVVVGVDEIAEIEREFRAIGEGRGPAELEEEGFSPEEEPFPEEEPLGTMEVDAP